VESVENIVDDDEALKEKAKDMAGIDQGEDVQLGPEKTAKPFETIDSSVFAVLVKMKSKAGAIKVQSENIRTGPNESGIKIVLISKDRCIIVGEPTIRFFRRQSS